MAPVWLVAASSLLAACSARGPVALFINEVAAAGEPADDFNPDGSDWIELYNAGPGSVSLRDYRLHDKPDDFDHATPLRRRTRIGPRGFLVIYFNRDSQGAPVVPKALGSDEEVVLYSHAGRVIDRVDWNDSDSPAGGSFGREPDGGSRLRPFARPTPNRPNR